MLSGYYVLVFFKVSRAPREGITQIESLFFLNIFPPKRPIISQDLCRQEAILGTQIVVTLEGKQSSLTLALKRKM